MTSRIAILCPGQGGQHPAMFELARTEARAAMLLEQWIAASGLEVPLDAVLSDDALLFSNRFAQPLIVAATLATWEAVKDHVPSPTLVAGYSIGEVAAYGVAGALEAGKAISLAASRARLMDACATERPGQVLMAVSNLNGRRANEFLNRHGFHIAIETGEDSFIAGGLSQSLSHVEIGIAGMGGCIKMLPVEVASHTPYMQPAAKEFAAELGRSHFGRPSVPVLAGISATPVRDADQAMSTLSRQVAEKIVWMDCMDACFEAGINVALELGPGSALSRMLQARHPSIECRSIADFRTLKGIQIWLARRAT